MKKRPFEHYATRIIANFNFENVHKAMIATNWHWSFGYDANKNERKGIPTIETLKFSAIDKLRKAYESGLCCSSGGFTAGWEEDEMFLSFELENFTTYD